VAEKWFELNKSKWKDFYTRTVHYRLDRYVIPDMPPFLEQDKYVYMVFKNNAPRY